MNSLLSIALVGAVLVTLFYVRVRMSTGTLVTAISMALLSASGFASVWLMSLMWVIFLPVALFINVPNLRRTWLTKKVYKIFQKVLPSMSETERDALEAGNVWWDAQLFSGRPHWQMLFDTPAATLSEEEQNFIQGPVRELCAMIDDWSVTEKIRDLPAEVWQFIKDKGFFGMIIPKQYGGLEFSNTAHSQVVISVASRSITAATTIMVPNSLGPAELLLRYGTQEQKDHYLPRLAKGQEIPCFALTGPDAGSDAGNMPDNGIVCRGEFEGKETVGILLNWEKRYITLGPVATVLGLAFKLYDPNHILGQQTDLGITLALIPTTTPGVDIGKRHFPLNIAFQNGPNWGKDVFIPLDWIIGGPSQIGKGWRMLMEALAAGRSISLPALSTGAGKLASRATGAYARIRRQFKLPIGRFEGVEEALTRIAGYTYQMEAARKLTLAALDKGEQPSVISAIVKYNLTERMRRVVNDAMDVQGGSGICLGPRNLIGRVYQGIPISITVEGANILTRSLIIFGQGAIRCHPYVYDEMRAAQDHDEERGLINFDRAFMGHVGFFISNAVRSFLLGLTRGRLTRVPGNHEGYQKYLRHINRMSASFAFLTDFAMLTLGGALKRKEKLSGRFADCLSNLYLASAAVKLYIDQGKQQADLPLLQWSCEEALNRCQTALDGIINNFPNFWLARLARLIVFPIGLTYKATADSIGPRITEVILQPGNARDRLTDGVYVPDDPDQALARLDATLEKVIAAEVIESRIRKDLAQISLPDSADELARVQAAQDHGLINDMEASVLRAAIEARREVITVDHFDENFWHKEQAWQNEQQQEAVHQYS